MVLICLGSWVWRLPVQSYGLEEEMPKVNNFVRNPASNKAESKKSLSTDPCRCISTGKIQFILKNNFMIHFTNRYLEQNGCVDKETTQITRE